jgi:hypothetical protein
MPTFSKLCTTLNTQHTIIRNLRGTFNKEACLFKKVRATLNEEGTTFSKVRTTLNNLRATFNNLCSTLNEEGTSFSKEGSFRLTQPQNDNYYASPLLRIHKKPQILFKTPFITVLSPKTKNLHHPNSTAITQTNSQQSNNHPAVTKI